jgi:hypothetical protein
VRLASAGLLAVLVLAGCGGDDNGSDAAPGTDATTTTPTTTTTTTTTTRAPSSWNGPPEPAEDGTMSVAGFNEYAQTLPRGKRVPRELAIEFLQVQQPYEVELETRPGGTTVTVLQDNLEDDSVRARRYTLEFALVTQGAVNLSSARVDYQCHEGRGHQDFSPELCL